MSSNREMSSRARIDVVIPVYNKIRVLSDAVASVVAAAEAYGKAQVWLVDNGSTDGSFDLVVEQFGDRACALQLVSGTIAAVRNFGAKQGTAPIISFIDCDCLVPADYFSRLDAVMSETDAQATGCMVILPPNPTWVEAVWNRMHDDGGEGSRAWINSANFAIRRAIFERVGGFNESCETDEDSEICFRIRCAGGRIMSDRRLEAAHLDNAKSPLAFFRKERWRASGMFSTTLGGGIDRATMMMVAHIMALLAALGIVVLAHTTLLIRLVVALAFVLLVPVMTVAYRSRSSVAAFGVAPGILLYELFYAARIAAVIIIAARAVRRRI